MRKLWLFSLLCVGAAALLACWLVAYVVIGGWALRSAGWTAPGLLLALLLLAAGTLVVPFMRATGEFEDGAIVTALRVYLGTAAVAMVTAAITMGVAGPQVYHARFGERTEAFITETEPVLSSEGDKRIGTRYHVVSYATEEDLGWLLRGPVEREAEGARVVVSVDPRGWVDPVAAERLGWTAFPTTVLVACLAATTLTALGIVAAALRVW